jgi:MSHA biogenesis protein MshP
MTLRARSAIKLPPLRMPRQAGFTLVTGIFLITILFLLSAFMISFRVYQDSSTSLDTLGTRAFAAARSGIEWGAYNSLHNNTCAAPTSLALAGTLAGYTATVTCTRSLPPYDEAGTPVNIDTIVANACNQPAGGNCPNPAPGANYAEREMTITVGQ